MAQLPEDPTTEEVRRTGKFTNAATAWDEPEKHLIVTIIVTMIIVTIIAAIKLTVIVIAIVINNNNSDKEGTLLLGPVSFSNHLVVPGFPKAAFETNPIWMLHYKGVPIVTFISSRHGESQGFLNAGL